MPRQIRYRFAGIPQHFIVRGNNRKPGFFGPIQCPRSRVRGPLRTRSASRDPRASPAPR